MKIFFIGTVELSKRLLEKLINLDANIVGVATKEKAGFNADFADLSQVCIRNNIPFRHVQDINLQENIEWIVNLKPDIIFCFGWSQILKKEALNIAPMGVVGFHPAKLPKNRGRHPIIWALVLGLQETAATFFFIDEGVDNGDILSQKEIKIDYEDNAQSLYNKITQTALKQIEEFLPRLQNKTFNRIPQDDTRATYLRKRDKKDGEIDFSSGSRTIYNLVRGLTSPYVGAHLLYKDKEIKVWAAKEVTVNKNNTGYGKVLDINGNQISVKCFDGAVLLTRHEFKEFPKVGEYLL